MIELDAVSKFYGQHAAIDAVSLRIERGEICALVGPSGAGKSTLLRMINRLIPHDAGIIRIEGVDIADLPPVALRRRIGYVIQSVGLFPHWTVGQNIATVPRLLGWEDERVQERVSELLNLVGLHEDRYAGRYAHQLSGGEQQRVGVARALAADPDVLLMDEPFGALDPLTRENLRTELLRIHAATKKTIVIVTHDIDEAFQLGSRVAILGHGRLIQQGTPRDILAAPASGFVHDFIGGARASLRLLKVETVRDRLRRPVSQPMGEPVPASAPLEDALAQMIARGCRALPVSDGKAGIIGMLDLADLVEVRS